MAWIPDPKCCWCRASFVQRDFQGTIAWVCPTEACFNRQLRWMMADTHGKLFYLPMPKQVEIEEAVETQQYGAICAGGSRGGGKSVALRRLAQRLCQRFPDFTVLFLRRTFPELVRNHTRFCPREAERLDAKFASFKFTFPATGSEIEMGHCQDPDDFKKYIGAEADLIAIDQIEMFTEQQIAELSASTGRITRSDWRGLMVAGENPGGPLSGFVDELFVSKRRDPKRYPDYDPSLYHFIPSTLDDNPYVDKRYVNFLAGLEPAKRDMYRYGKRDVFPRQMFAQWQDDRHARAFVLPPGTRSFRSLQWGYNAPGMILWWAILPTGQLYIRYELAIEKQDENTVAAEIGRIDRILRFTVLDADDKKILTKPSYTVANPDVFNATKPSKRAPGLIGHSIAETLGTFGVPLLKGDDDRVNGWKRVQALLGPSPDGTPWLTVHPDCARLIKSIKTAMSDELKPEDLDAAIAAPALHALRFGAMSRPTPATTRVSVTIPVGSPAWVMQKLRARRHRLFGRVA